MSEKINVEIGDIFDEMFQSAKKFGDQFRSEFRCGPWNFHDWDGSADYYPAQHYPPCNICVDKNNNMTLEFALAGFNPEDIILQFTGDFLVLSAKIPESRSQETEGIRYLKRRLKFRAIENQKYFVPADKYNHDSVKAGWNKGILTVYVPAREKQAEKTVNINIEKE